MILNKNSFRLLTPALALLILFAGNSSLAQDTVSELEEITIIASRVEMPLRQVGASVSVLTVEDLEQKNFPALADVLRSLPSISVTQSGGLGKATGLRIRGEEAHRTLLLIDGINVSDVSAVQAMPRLGHVVNSQFGRVEVLRGPQGMMYGADAGGVISVYSKQSDQALEGDLGVEAGSFNTRQLNGNLRGTVDQLSYSLTASDLSSDGFNAREDDSTADDDGYDNTTLHGTAAWALTTNSSLGLVLRNTDGESQFDGCGFPTSYNCQDEYKNYSGKANWLYKTEKQNHELAYQRNNTENVNTVVDQGYSTLDSEGELQQWQYLGHYSLAEDLGFVFGTDHRSDKYINNLTLEEFERDQTGAFAEGQVSFGDTFFYTAGVRYDDNEDFGEHVSYRLTTAYLLPVVSGELKFKGSYGTAFRAPSLYEIGYNNGDYAAPYVPRDLTEETSRGYELGVEWLFSDNTFAELVWFDNRIEDEIFFDLVGFGGYLQAQGETESKGIEFNASLEIIHNLVFSGNYTYNDTELSEDTTLIGAEPGGQRPRRPKHMYNVSLAYDFGERVNLAAFYRNSRDAVDYVFGTGRVALDDYQVLDVTGSWQITDAVETYLRWENALDEEYREVPGYNTAGSAAYAGVRIRF